MNPKTKFNTPSSSSPKRRRSLPPTISLTNPRFVFLLFFNTRLRAIIDGSSTWYHYEDVMNQPDLEKASRSMHQRQRLVRSIIAKWDPFPSRMRKYTVLSESDFYRLMYAAKVIEGESPFDLDEAPGTNQLAQPGGDFDAHELESYRMQLMDDWNVRA